MTDFENILHEKVNIFRTFAKENYPDKTEDNDNGEWGIGTEFYDMFDSACDVIKNLDPHMTNIQTKDDLLYAIARDNEGEVLIEYLKDYPNWFKVLCRKVLCTNYTNAKWQFAKQLPKYQADDNLKDLIFDFLQVEDEYTQRMSLQALAEIYPDKAEEYAVYFWERDKFKDNAYCEEYQKIMVLHVLKDINSSKLEHYLDLALKSDFYYLRQNAKDILDSIK